MMKFFLLLPVSLAHFLAPFFLKVVCFFRKRVTYQWSPFQWHNLQFLNPLGIAGGIDKNAFNVDDWWTQGVGFIEIGTVTPQPQKANPSPVLLRDTQNKILWNKLGFPNKGAEFIKKRLLKLKKPYPTPIFLNIGQNRQTPKEHASDDYISLIQDFRLIVDGFVINISSPNTKGLRDLASPSKIKTFLEPIAQVACGGSKPCHTFLKISPDMTAKDFFHLIDVSLSLGFKGWILTNTTEARPSSSSYPLDGGLSGAFLKEKSLKHLQLAHHYLIEKLGEQKRKEYLLISVGGVLSPSDVKKRLFHGADLVQVYTALVFEGPYFFKSVAMEAKNSIPKS